MLPPRFVLLCWVPVMAVGCVSSASYSVSHGFVEAQEGPLGGGAREDGDSFA